MSAEWRWICHSAAGSDLVIDGFDEVFTHQAEAESWLGEVYGALLDHGAVSATLYEGERAVYGPMSLEA